MDFRDLLLALRRYWMVAAGVAVLVCVIGGAAAFLPQKTYRSAATIVLDFSDESTASIQEVNFLLPALEQRAQSQRLADAAEGRVPEELRTPRPRIDAVIEASVLRIGATATRPVAAQAWADAAAEQLIEEREGEPPLELELLEPAPFRAEPVAPKVLPILMATLVVALVAAVFSGLAADRAITVYRQSFGRLGAEPDEPVKPDDPRRVRGARLVPRHLIADPAAAEPPADHAADPDPEIGEATRLEAALRRVANRPSVSLDPDQHDPSVRRQARTADVTQSLRRVGDEPNEPNAVGRDGSGPLPSNATVEPMPEHDEPRPTRDRRRVGPRRG